MNAQLKVSLLEMMLKQMQCDLAKKRRIYVAGALAVPDGKDGRHGWKK
jgi:hypothetical protein